MDATAQETAAEMKKRHQEEVNNFEGLFFAFSNKQLEEGMQKIGANSISEICSLGAGGYLLKSRVKDFSDMFKRQKEESKKKRKEQKTIKIKFAGIDGWNRPVFVSTEKPYQYYGSTCILFNYNDTEETVLSKIDEDDLSYFGNHFGCEPMGTIAGNIEIV